jgi:hypothetical protein
MKDESNVIYINASDMIPKHMQTNVSISLTSISLMKDQKYVVLENLSKIIEHEYYTDIKGVLLFIIVINISIHA